MGQSTQHHRFRFASAVVSVSVRGAAAPRTGAGELHRQCFASVGQCAVAQIWPRLACASCWISRRLRLGLATVFVAVVAHARYGHPLRFYITPHCPQCPPVAALKLRLVPVTASRPSGEGNRRYAKWPSLESVAQPSALPGRWHALRVAVCAPLWLSVALWHWSGAARCVAGQWPAASHVVCAPAHPCASPLRGISPARWSARPPPVGAPSARAPLLLGFATGLIADPARNTGATGLTACKPAWPLAYFSGAMAAVSAMHLIAACARSMRARGLFGI